MVIKQILFPVVPLGYARFAFSSLEGQSNDPSFTQKRVFLELIFYYSYPINSFINLLNTYLLSAHYVAGTRQAVSK